MVGKWGFTVPPDVFHWEIFANWEKTRGDHLYSKVDIMLEYINTEKGLDFHGEARTAWPVFRVSKTAKIKKRV